MQISVIPQIISKHHRGKSMNVTCLWNSLGVLRWCLWLRKLRSSKKVKILQDALVLQAASWKKNFLSWRKEMLFLPYFYCCAKLFECPFNFKFCSNTFIFLNNTNQTPKEQELYFIRCSNSYPWGYSST